MKRTLNLWLLLLAFLIPIAVAWVMLNNQWYQGGVTNRGELLETPVTVGWISPETPQWQIVYLYPEECGAPCQGALFNLRQVPQVIGESEKRLQSMLLRSTTVNDIVGISAIQATGEQASQWRSLPYGEEAIYITDPLGNVMMAYPLVEGKEAILAQGKDIIRDLKRLLKVSKIG